MKTIGNPLRAIAPVATLVSVTSVVITGLLVGMRELGWLQPLELAVFDQMVRLQPMTPPDPRLLIVGITEADIQAQGWPLSDQVLAEVLATLDRHKPRAIGLDLFRGTPQGAGQAALQAQFKNPKLRVIKSLGNPGKENSEGIPAPAGVPIERVGFNDVVIDPDGVVRRNTMFASDGKSRFLSFSLQLALAYLEPENIPIRLTQAKEFQMGNVVFAKLQPNDGGYHGIDTGGYQILLHYRAKTIAQHVTLTQVLQGQLNPEWVNDKIVLIGVEAPSLKDVFFTPYSALAGQNRQMPGVMIHAQMISQLLSSVLDRQPLFWFWPDTVEVLWILAWAVLGGSLATWTRNPLLLGIRGTLLLLGLAGISFGLFLHQGWVPLVAPALAAIASGGVIIGYQLQQTGQQQKMVMKLLGQQTSPAIAEELWRSRDHLLQAGLLPWQRMTVTLLFIDVKGFTTLSEGQPPDVLMLWLNEFLRQMTQLVQRHQGIVNKFTGDGLMAVFGVPVSRTTPEEIAADAQQAVQCALAMRSRLETLNQDWQQRGLPAIQMRVGIFTGPVITGSLGGKERLEYGVIGDSVNIASRLESYDKEQQVDSCRILIAQETLEHLHNQFPVEPLGSILLKGKQRAIDVFRLL